MCHIFVKHGIQGYQLWHSRVSNVKYTNMQIQKYKNNNMLKILSIFKSFLHLWLHEAVLSFFFIQCFVPSSSSSSAYAIAMWRWHVYNVSYTIKWKPLSALSNVLRKHRHHTTSIRVRKSTHKYYFECVLQQARWPRPGFFYDFPYSKASYPQQYIDNMLSKEFS